jgi:hypothetical protein
VGGLATASNIERKDIGVILRVTPQISEGDSLRLKIFQEITQVNQDLTETTGNAEEVGVSLTKRNVENVVVVNDGETVVIGGLIGEVYSDNETGVPWLKDIPFFGWAFKTVGRELRKTNLLIFLTPNIIRTVADLEEETIKRREQFREKVGFGFELSEEERAEAEKLGLEPGTYLGQNPVKNAVRQHAQRYPLERMSQIEQDRALERERTEASAAAGVPLYEVRSGLFDDEEAAMRALTEVVDSGYDAALVSGEREGELTWEIRIGPFDDPEEARTVSDVVGQSLGLETSVTLRPPEPEAP